ncbi:MAG TPA: SagB/ThcOx family dehydrogenase [Methylomusa anaerophila]|uniref:Nitroreductase family protein n=1 Tax=Methylomusa anaerophila TaxID=1930071 RepID=A0A348AHJ6_9FIRM|nr:SagB/ThcOx family dehydrogenase [Methylomusa anaerophila]BBB90544.1 nitroreductase family protein [Methylomusa anaerophila]HML89815.1 SagB/ThcOx family dehydrogenase [Methylomusa anaerophila]
MTAGIGKEFMERTKYKNMEPADQIRGLPHPPVELDFSIQGSTISLPLPAQIPDDALTATQAMYQRKSVRQYSDKPLTLDELSYLLWCTQGVKSVEAHLVTMRTVPSAGARHAFETYILINRVEGLQPGLYRFLAVDHELAPVKLSEDISDLITDACLKQKFVKASAVTFIWTAAMYRMTYRYGQRGYRYVHLDAGHVCQNLYLSAEVIRSGVCAIAAFDDDKLNGILDIDGENQFAVYVAAVGKKVE